MPSGETQQQGQVPIPADLRRRRGFAEGHEFEVVEDGNTQRIAHSGASHSRGERAVAPSADG